MPKADKEQVKKVKKFVREELEELKNFVKKESEQYPPHIYTFIQTTLANLKNIKSDNAWELREIGLFAKELPKLSQETLAEWVSYAASVRQNLKNNQFIKENYSGRDFFRTTTFSSTLKQFSKNIEKIMQEHPVPGAPASV